MGLFSKTVPTLGGPIVMYDGTAGDIPRIPGNAALVASYVDGYGGYSQAVARFGKARTISISVSNNDADVADVEPGAMVASDLPGWVDRQQARGVKKPVVYSDRFDHTACFAAVGNRVSYWIADPVGSPITLPGADAVQYIWTANWDASWVLPSFPFYPGKRTPPNPTPVLRFGAHNSYVAKAQKLLNRHGGKPVLVVDGVFGNETLKRVKDFQDYHKLKVDGVIGKETWKALLSFRRVTSC